MKWRVAPREFHALRLWITITPPIHWTGVRSHSTTRKTPNTRRVTASRQSVVHAPSFLSFQAAVMFSWQLIPIIVELVSVTVRGIISSSKSPCPSWPFFPEPSCLWVPLIPPLHKKVLEKLTKSVEDSFFGKGTRVGIRYWDILDRNGL